MPTANEPYHLRRHDKAMESPEAMAEVLLKARVVTMAMCAEDRPYLVVVNHGYERESHCLYFHCAPSGRKMDILRDNPRVWGIALEDLGYLDGQCDHAYRSVMFGGRVEFLSEVGEKRRALELMIRQHESDPERVMSDQLTPARIAATTIGRIRITEMSGKEALPR